MQNEEVLEKPENYSKQQDFRGSNGDSRGWSRVSHRHTALHNIYSWKVFIKVVHG